MRLPIIVWKNLSPKLLELIAQEHREREQLVYAARLAERSNEAAPFYAALIATSAHEDDRPLMPNLHDACRLPSLAALLAADDARTPVSQARFTTISSQLLVEAQQYIRQAKCDLAEMIWRVKNTQHSVVLNPDKRPRAPPMPPMDATEIEALLARGTTLFVCKNCPVLGTGMYGVMELMSARRACVHWRECHPGLQWNDGWPYEGVYDKRRSFKLRPKRLPFVDAYSGESYIRKAVVEIGLNENASHVELDTLVRTSRLICMCGSPRLQPVGDLSWAKLVTSCFPLPIVM